MRKICHYFFTIPMLLTCMFSVGQSVLAADELSPNLRAATIVFDPSDGNYEFTGDPVVPVFSVELLEVVNPTEYTYTIISSDDKIAGTSDGTSPGKVTIEIEGLGSASFGYYGSIEASFNIVKADGLKANDENISLTSGNGSFDLDTIILDKTNYGERSYSLGNLTDESDIVSDIAINDSILNYSATGKKGKAEQIITITTDNYKDIDVIITFENETADYVKGDINGDGSFDVLDVVLLQKWLLSVPDTSLANWQAADFCGDNQLNIFDLCMMKRELIKGETTMENKDINAVRVNMPTIVDDYDEITNDMKEMIWKKLESQYPNTDLTDFTFVYEPKHPFSKAVKGWIFSIYYKDILLRGLGTTIDDVYAIVISKQNQCERVDIHFIVDPICFSKIDVTAHCISKSEAVSPDMYVEEPELIIYTVWNELPCLAYRAVKENGDGEYIINAITGEIIEYIPYYFT